MSNTQFSDYASINEMVAHGTAADEADAGRLTLQAGVDMDLQGDVYRKCLQPLFAGGQVTEAQINAAAKRILEVKSRLGLFDDPYRYCDEQREARLLLAPEHRAAAHRMACESFVLLKNSAQTLPLAAGHKIAVLGLLVEARQNLLGLLVRRGNSRGD